MARRQTAEGLLQCLDLQLTIQTHSHRQVVGGAGRLQLPEKPHALLRVRQAVTLGDAVAGGHGQLRKIDAFAGHAGEEQTAFVLGQFDKAAG